MRKHVSLATVLATLALFFALSGTAMAAVVITSNHQVAAHTIAGANAPAGDNKNLIAGSVGTSDLHTGAVTGAKIADGSLTGADLANGSIGTGKLKLPEIGFSGPDTDTFDLLPHHSVLSLDGVTLGVSCTLGQPATTFLLLFVKSSVSGTIRGSYADGSPNSAVTEQSVEKTVAATPVRFASIEVSTGTQMLVGQFIYHDANRVIAFTLDGSATFDNSCDLHGTAVPAPN